MATNIPGDVSIREIDLSVYAPVGSNAIVGIIGPAARGEVDKLEEYSNEGALVDGRGRPVDRHHSVRAAIRYLRLGNQVKHVRVAGTLLSFATATLRNASLDKDILVFTAKTKGTWANGDVQVAVVHNGSPATSYDVYVYYRGARVDDGNYANLTNSTVVTAMANDAYVTVALATGAGTDFPDATVDSVTGQLVPVGLSGGNDGAFASTASEDSSTGGIGERLNYTANLFTGTVATAYTGTVGMAVSPGSFIVTAPGPSVWTDDGEGNLTGPAASGSGFINYATGAWLLKFAVAPVGVVTAAWTRGWAETAASVLPATLIYSGTLSRPGVMPGSNKVLFTHVLSTPAAGVGGGPAVLVFPALFGVAATVYQDGPTAAGCRLRITATITAILRTFTWNGTLVAATGLMNFVSDTGGFTATLDPATGNVVFSLGPDLATNVGVVGVYRGQDAGAGVITGYNIASGTINYQTGAWAITFTAQPTLTTTIGAFYEHVTILGTGNGVLQTFSGTIDEVPVRVGSVSVTDGVETFTDNSDGTLTGSAGGTGTVNYWTGAISVTFFGIPALGAEVIVTSARVLAHVTSIHLGPIGNERTVITDGLFCRLSAGSVSGLKFEVMFNPGTGAVAVETFDNEADLATLITDVNSTSEYVQLESLVTTSEPNVTVTQNIGMAGAFTNADVIGAHVGALYTGMQLFSDPDRVPCHFLTVPGVHHRQVYSAGESLCSSRRMVWLGSMPDFTPPAQMGEDLPGVSSSDPVTDSINFTNGVYPVNAKVPYPLLVASNSTYVFWAGLWGYYYDQYKDAEVWEPPEGDILGLAAYTDSVAYPWFAIAGERRGTIDWSAVRYSPDKGERKRMCPIRETNPNVVNPIVEIVNRGIFLKGQRTAYRTNSSRNRLNIRWMLNVMENSIDAACAIMPFEQNDDVAWREIESLLKGVVEPIAANRGMNDVRVQCDETTNDADAQENHIFKANIFIKPTLTAEEIEISAILTSQGASFEEVGG